MSEQHTSLTQKRPDYDYQFKTLVVQCLFRAYSSVYFSYFPLLGAWFLLISFFSPRTAFVGLVGVVSAWLWGYSLSIKPPGDLHLVNSLLCGLFLAAFYPLSWELIMGIVVISLFITICVNWFTQLMWDLGKVPLMTLPFVLGTWILMLIFQNKQLIVLPSLILIDGNLPSFLSWSVTNTFFSSIGGLFLVPYPVTGALIFLGLLVTSRYLALLVVSGYIVGMLTLYLLGYHFLAVQYGFNFMLVAMALGGIFMIPGRFTFFMALCGSALSALFTVALYKILFPLQLPLLVLPFLLSSYFVLGGLSYRNRRYHSTLNLDAPISPELASERYRLECARGLHLNSTFIYQNFLQEWKVAYDPDFEQIYFSRSIKGTEQEPMIYTPANGIVVEMRDDSSTSYKTAPVDKKLGNFILLRNYFGNYILLPFLKEGSVKPLPNALVTQGEIIAACKKWEDGAYRFYVQVEQGVRTYSNKLPFHLTYVISSRGKQQKQFNIFYYPLEGDSIVSAVSDPNLIDAMKLQPGLNLQYAITLDNQEVNNESLQTGMAFQGGPRLYASRDRSVAYEKGPLSIIYYDLQGSKSTLLNLWVLAMSTTPLTSQADFWQDEPSLKQWPLGFAKRLLVSIVKPLGVNCKSTYTRTWNESTQTWIQEAIHHAHILPGVTWQAQSKAVIKPHVGVTELSLKLFGRTWEAKLIQNDK